MRQGTWTGEHWAVSDPEGPLWILKTLNKYILSQEARTPIWCDVYYMTVWCVSETMHFPAKGKILYLGEGDFSLTRSLCEKHQLPKDAVVTCYAAKLTDEAASNSAFLQSSGESYSIR